MMKNEQISLNAKDFIVVLEMAFAEDIDQWTYQTLASLTGMSPSQVHGSVGRLLASGLLNGKGLKAKVNREALSNFIVHGARYCFPPMLGRPGRGLPTGASSPLFEAGQLLREVDIPIVWLHPQGTVRGTSLAPIHPCVLEAIKHNPMLHKVLVHFDAIRTGKARERKGAEAFFRQRLAWSS